MVHYLFTNDLRRDKWPEILTASAKLIRDECVPSADEDKSTNNYINTQTSYLCLQKGARANEFCCHGNVQPVILNFINRFQFPNARTKSSYFQSVDDAMTIAPLRLAVQLMYALGLAGKDQAYITYDELYSDVIANEDVARNLVSVFSLASQIISDRASGIELKKVPSSSDDISLEECEWKHGGRQIRELFDILKFVPFITEDTVVGGFRLSIPEITDSLLAKQFFNIINNHDFWSAPEGTDWNEIRESYMKYMDEGLDMFSENSVGEQQKIMSTEYRQLITYGAPGTGKSHKVKDEYTAGMKKENVFRTTFHPDSDYSTFVGAYKPTTSESRQVILDYESLVDKFKEYLSVQPANVTRSCALFGNDYHDSILDMQEHGRTIPDLVNDAYKSGTTYDSIVRAGMSVYEQSPSRDGNISYSFIPQAFVNAYVKAWQTTDKVALVIEEINRGNCAQIFGDLFQLLDRSDGGWSDYAVDADADLAQYLGGVFAKKFEAREGMPDDVTEEEVKCAAIGADGRVRGRLVLPPNLYIYATMNTSDQSLFPIDSAFKRRWEWEYVPIEDAGKGWKIDVGGVKYKWWSFLEKINALIATETNSEDKQLGYFFVKAKGDEIDAKTFVSKVIFYLWGDVFKDNLPDDGENGDAFQYTFMKDGKTNKRPIRFADFYHPETGNTKEQWRDKLLTSFLDALKVEKDAPADNASDTPNASGQGLANADGGVAKVGE